MFNTTETSIPYILFYDNGDQVVPTHWHKEIEFSYSIKGETRVLVNDRMYEIPEGEAILINGGDTHFYFSTKDHKRIVIILDLEIIQGAKDYLDLRRSLVHAFSNNSNGRPESRCKECQRTRQRQRRQAAGNTQQATASKPERVLITDVAERETRLEMIRNAIETVQLSMIRRACKQHENEFYLETGWKIKMLYKEEL